MADAMEALRQHVEQEAADELVDLERHRLVAVAAVDPIILAFERHAPVVGAISRLLEMATRWV